MYFIRLNILIVFFLFYRLSSVSASRKYRACIQGLKDGHSFAVARDRCPPRSLSMPVVWAVSDRLIGLPLSSCPKNSCRNNKPSQRG